MKKRFNKVYVEITNSCNLDCDFCIKNKRKQEFITINNLKKVLKVLKDYTDYLYLHILGEPLLHPKINEIIDIASKNFKINITTNGYLLNKIENNKHIRQVNISLHSYSSRYKVSLNDYLENIFNTVDKLLENDTYISLRLWVKNKYSEDIIKYINNRYKVNIPLNFSSFTIKEKLFLNSFHEFIWPDFNNNYYSDFGTCYALRDHIGILVNGDIIPCCLDSCGEIKLGNIYEIDNLDNILNSNRVVNMIENFKNNKKVEELCKHCLFIEKNN